MKIKELFDRDITRSINGVVKADQRNEALVWQELDEFVVTRELTRHLTDLIAVVLDSIEGDASAANKNGVWVSGFFGCGKSHFIKVLSYLFENEEHQHQGESRRAVDFFEDKIEDPVLFADLKRVVATNIDAILFNVDSKADHREGRDALLQVFLKVLNEKQGFSGDHPHIAHMERHLEEKGKLDVFHAAFQREAGASWVERRDAYEFHRDQLLNALQEALEQSEESVRSWIDGAEANFSLTVENFAKWVRRYLDAQGEGHQIMFLADEVGQFIGQDTHLMLHLQTITEELGVVCDGRAWVVVTSQEDLDSVLGDVKNVRQHDFSKIQGRFKTRLSLSSQNADEVIKERLLAKTDAANAELAAAYAGKHDILKNQLSFGSTGMSMKAWADEADFAACYPFPAYQFDLVQKVFESIRKAGATGQHLARGERSTLDAFQGAAKALAEEEVGALAAFHLIYPSVEGFLDTAVKLTIGKASERHSLEPFDTTILQVLFLIRYVEEVPGSVDNLVTLCIDQMDADKLALRKEIEASLNRLESETLVARNGALYFFLTNEERDIGREIKNEIVPSGAAEREIGKLLYEDLLRDQRKHTYSVTGRDFTFSRVCDGHPVGRQEEGSLVVESLTPLGDEYSQYTTDESCALRTAGESVDVLLRLPDDDALGREVRTYLQTESYVKTKNTGALPDTTKRILRDRSEDNRARRKRILLQLETMAGGASFFASGKKLEPGSKAPKEALSEALEYVIGNSFPKMSFIEHLHSNPKQEIQSILRANDLEKGKLDLKGPESNAKALDEIREYVRLCDMRSHAMVLHEVVNKKFASKPFGWPEMETVLLLSRLLVLKEIDLEIGEKRLAPEEAYDYVVSSSQQKKVLIKRREVADEALIAKAAAVAKEVLGQSGPTSEEGLFSFVRDQLLEWNQELDKFLGLAKTGKYPGAETIEAGMQSLRKFVKESDSLKFLRRLVENKGELQELAEDYGELHEFYTTQRAAWESLGEGVTKLSPNRHELLNHAEGGAALRRMEEILKMPAPYAVLNEVGALVHAASEANEALVQAAREPAAAAVKKSIADLDTELDRIDASPELRASAQRQLEECLRRVEDPAASIAHIDQARAASESSYDQGLRQIEEASTPPEPEPGEEPKPPAPKVKKHTSVAVRDLVTAPFLETQADVDAFLVKLRGVLEAALADDHRIRLK